MRSGIYLRLFVFLWHSHTVRTSNIHMYEKNTIMNGHPNGSIENTSQSMDDVNQKNTLSLPVITTPTPPGSPETNIISESFTNGFSSAQNSYGKTPRLIKGTLLAMEDELSLTRLLTTIISQDLKECDLILIVDRSFIHSKVLENLVRLWNFRQVVMMSQSYGDLVNHILWKSPRCQGILVLISDPETFLAYGNERSFPWDFNSRLIIAGLSRESIEQFIKTIKGKHIEQIIGIVKSGETGTFKVFMNELYWGRRGLKQVFIWTRESSRIRTKIFPEKTSNLQEALLNGEPSVVSNEFGVGHFTDDHVTGNIVPYFEDLGNFPFSLEVVIFEWRPAIIYHRDSDGKLIERYGRDVEVIKALSVVFNFTYNYVEPDPRELFGQPLPNGSYSGMVGLLGSGHGDLAIANLWIIAHAGRDKFQEFSTPFDDDKSCFLARIEPPLPLWQSPGLPFQMTTWIIIIAGLVLAGPVLYLLSSSAMKSIHEVSSLRSLPIASLYAYGIHFSHPMANLPTRSSTKLFIAFLWIYSIILTSGYRSNLTAFLTITRQPDSIETFRELYESGLMVLGIPFFKIALETSGNLYLRDLSLRYDARMRFEEASEDILAGKAVTINSNVYLEMFGGEIATSTGKASFRIMKECFGQFAVAVAYQKNSPLKRNFDKIITRMFESGLSRKWFLKSLNTFQQLENENNDNIQEKSEEKSDGVIALGLDHLQGVFIVWAFGSIISTSAFIIEVFAGADES